MYSLINVFNITGSKRKSPDHQTSDAKRQKTENKLMNSTKIGII